MKRLFKIIGLVFDSIFFLSIGAVIGALAFYAYMGYSHDLSKSVRVPDLRGMSVTKAVKILKDYDLVPDVKGKVCGKVIGTYPSADTEVKRGRRVEIYCIETTMKELANMLVGIPFRYVADTMLNLGLSYEVSRLPYPGGEGKVLGAVYMNGKMFLLVGERYSRKFFVVGDYRGIDLKEAESRLKKSGYPFRVEGTGKKVIDQFPQPGSVWDSVVLITG